MNKGLRYLTTVMLLALTTHIAFGQSKDKGRLIEYKNPFLDSIKEAVKTFEKQAEEPKLKFKMDFEGYDLPESREEFTQYWHNDPVAQGSSGRPARASPISSRSGRMAGERTVSLRHKSWRAEPRLCHDSVVGMRASWTPAVPVLTEPTCPIPAGKSPSRVQRWVSCHTARSGAPLLSAISR